MADSPAEVSLHWYTQCGQQMGGVGSHCVATNLPAMTETRWDESHDWSVAVSGYMASSEGRAEEGERVGLPMAGLET